MNTHEVEGRATAQQEKAYHYSHHQDYEPGRRFYFDDPSGFEVEVVSYTEVPA